MKALIFSLLFPISYFADLKKIDPHVSNDKVIVVTIWPSSNPLNDKKGEAYQELKKVKDDAIHFHEHAWMNKEELNTFFKSIPIDLQAVSTFNGLELEGKHGAVHFKTAAPEVTIIVRNKKVYCFIDQPFDNVESIKKCINL